MKENRKRNACESQTTRKGCLARNSCCVWNTFKCANPDEGDCRYVQDYCKRKDVPKSWKIEGAEDTPMWVYRDEVKTLKGPKKVPTRN